MTTEPVAVARAVPRINPDSHGVLVFSVIVTAILGCVSFLLSYSGLVEVAAWAAFPPELAWAVPVTLDGAILVYTIAALVFRARGESARGAWGALALFTSLSVASNGLHAWEEGSGDPRAVIGVLIAGLAPLAVLLTTHTLARLIVASPTPSEVATEAVSATEVAAEVVAPAKEVAPAGRTQSASQSRTAERNAEIRRLREVEGLDGRQIARRLGISPSTVSRVLNRPADIARPPMEAQRGSATEATNGQVVASINARIEGNRA